MTQLSRVRKVLLSRGCVYRTDFLAPNVIDGGDPILNLGERMADLRREGLVIDTVRLPNKTALYKLVGRPAAPAPTPPPVPDSPTSLFDQTVGHAPPRSPYEEAA